MRHGISECDLWLNIAMNLVLEIKYPGKTGSDKHLLEDGVYSVGSQEESNRGKPIVINSPFVNKDHALIEQTRAGWVITALQPQVRQRDKGNQLLEVRDPKKIGPGARFIIGNIELQFLAPEKDDIVDAKEALLGLTLDALIGDIHLRVTKETQLLTRTEKPDTEDPKYKSQVRDILANIIDETLADLDGAALHRITGDAARRDMIFRILGSAGVLNSHVPNSNVSEVDKLDFDKLQKMLSRKLGLIRDGKHDVEDLSAVNTRYEERFLSSSKNFSNVLLNKVLRQTLLRSIDDVIFGIGPLEYLTENEFVSEIMVVSADKIFVELNGNLVETGLSFVNEKSSQTITSYIVAQVGKQINVQNPYEDARLKDGSRVNAVVSPVAIDGTALTIRKFRASPLTVEQLIDFGCLSVAMASFLHACVVSKKNILVSGGTGTGKTTLVNWLGSMIPPDERLVTIEDVAELKLDLPHVVRLEARPASPDGKGEITIQHLVKNALRMRPDRIIVGECRGGEAFDMLQAMNTGHEGSLSTLHANTAAEATSRMENLVLMADQGLPIDAIRYQIAGAVDYIVQLKRYANGARKISEIAEIGKIDTVTNRIEVNAIFETDYDHTDPDAKAIFTFAGRTPDDIETLIKFGFDASTLSF
jgi:pilus assembly protein CpaF